MSALLNFVVERLAAMPARDRRLLAAETGIPFSTVQKITFRTSADPGVTSVEALYRALLLREGPVALPVSVDQLALVGHSESQE